MLKIILIVPLLLGFVKGNGGLVGLPNCEQDPCVNGECIDVTPQNGGDLYRCECDQGYTGNLCGK